jgi:hypothetical protein
VVKTFPFDRRLGPDAAVHVLQPLRGAADPGNREPAPLESEKDLPPANVAAETPQATVERIRGYKVPAEYLLITSRFFNRAVAAVSLPLDYEKQPDKRYPLVIAFGGAGECGRPPMQGALAWIDYYKADEAVAALDRKRLNRGDFRGLVTEDQLQRFNKGLQNSPYNGVILVCPYSPPLSPSLALEYPDYESFITEELLPELKKRYRVAPGAVGVDGVSMGGARAIYYGFKYPEAFSSIGAVQGAFGPFMDVYRGLARQNRDLLKKRAIQIVTSDKDSLALSSEKMHAMLQAEGIPHEYLALTGPHDYIFNQGPGSISLLVFHSRALSSRRPGPISGKEQR